MCIPFILKGKNTGSNTVNNELSNSWPKLTDIDTALIKKYDFNYKRMEGKQIQLR